MKKRSEALKDHARILWDVIYVRKSAANFLRQSINQRRRFLSAAWIYTPTIWQHHDDVIKWKHFPRYWPFVRGIHRSPVNSAHKGQWRGALMFSLICARINGTVNCEVGDLRHHRAHYDVIVMSFPLQTFNLYFSTVSLIERFSILQ